MDKKKQIIQCEYNIDDLTESLNNKDDKYFEITKNKYEIGFYCEVCGCDYIKIDQHLKTKMHDRAKICYVNELKRALEDKKRELFVLKDEVNAHFLKTYGYELYK